MVYNLEKERKKESVVNANDVLGSLSIWIWDLQ